MWALGVCWVLLGTLGAGSAQLTFLPIKSVTMGPCNKSAIIPCVVTNLQFNDTKTMFVKWTLDGKEFFSYDGFDDKVVKNATFQTAQLLNVHKLPEGIASLTLARNETIGGKYVCDVVESNREGELIIELKYIHGPCETSVVGSCEASDIGCLDFAKLVWLLCISVAGMMFH